MLDTTRLTTPPWSSGLWYVTKVVKTFDKLTRIAAVALGACAGCSLFTSFEQFSNGEPKTQSEGPAEGLDAAVQAPDAGTVDSGGGSDGSVATDGIFLRGLEKYVLTNSVSLTVDVPGGTEPGDLLVLAVISTYTGANGGGLPTTIPGWKTHRSGGSFPPNCDQGHRILIVSRIMQADDPTSIVVNAGQQWPLGGLILAYGGVNSTNPIDNDAIATLTESPLVAPSVETTSSQSLVLRFLALLPSPGPYVTTPTLLERTGIGGITVFEGVQEAAGPTGEVTFGLSKAISVCYANTVTIALRKK